VFLAAQVKAEKKVMAKKKPFCWKRNGFGYLDEMY